MRVGVNMPPCVPTGSGVPGPTVSEPIAPGVAVSLRTGVPVPVTVGVNRPGIVLVAPAMVVAVLPAGTAVFVPSVMGRDVTVRFGDMVVRVESAGVVSSATGVVVSVARLASTVTVSTALAVIVGGPSVGGSVPAVVFVGTGSAAATTGVSSGVISASMPSSTLARSILAAARTCAVLVLAVLRVSSVLAIVSRTAVGRPRTAVAKLAKVVLPATEETYSILASSTRGSPVSVSHIFTELLRLYE